MSFPGGSSPMGIPSIEKATSDSANHTLRHEFAAINPDQGASTARGFRDNENIPDRFEQFYREEGEKIVTSDPDTRVPNCTMFHFHKEDHTLGNLLKYQLHRNPHVIFSGYKVPHPLFAEFDLRIQTDGSLTPKDALDQACKELIKDLQTLDTEFTKEWELHRVRNLGQDGVGGGY